MSVVVSYPTLNNRSVRLGNGDDDQDDETSGVGPGQQSHSAAVPGPEQRVHDGHRQRHNVERTGHKLHVQRISCGRDLHTNTAKLGESAQSRQQPFQIFIIRSGMILFAMLIIIVSFSRQPCTLRPRVLYTLKYDPRVPFTEFFFLFFVISSFDLTAGTHVSLHPHPIHFML